MSHILLCVVPAPGHISPLLAVARHLKSVGHEVTILTADTFRDQVVSAGLRFVPVAGKANFDYRHLEDVIPGLRGFQGTDLMVAYCKFFGDVIPDQYQSIRRIMAEMPVDLILTDTPYWGALPLLLGPREKRPPIAACGVVPLLTTSTDFGFFSKPDTTPEGLIRNRQENDQFRAALQPANDHLNKVLESCGAPPTPHFLLDSMCILPDLFLQFTGDAFEFPRRDMPKPVRFVGPVLPRPSVNFKEPAWWSDLDSSKPVVLVTQGTIANFDFNELIQPTLSALADENVLVIAATGRPDIESIVVPPNAKVESFIPFDRLLPKVDVLVTNGGYGAVHQALSLGVPIVIAGESEDKALISARVDWAGVGVNLGTQHPTEDQIRSGVHMVLADKEYRRNAQSIQRNFKKYNALDGIAQAVESLVEQPVAN